MAFGGSRALVWRYSFSRSSIAVAHCRIVKETIGKSSRSCDMKVLLAFSAKGD